MFSKRGYRKKDNLDIDGPLFFEDIEVPFIFTGYINDKLA
jgi:hypothetical protein